MDVTESLQDYQYSSDDMDSPHKGVQKCGSGHIDVTVEVNISPWLPHKAEHDPYCGFITVFV